MLWKSLVGAVEILSASRRSWEVGFSNPTWDILWYYGLCPLGHSPPTTPALLKLWDPAFGMRQTLNLQPVLRV